MRAATALSSAFSAASGVLAQRLAAAEFKVPQQLCLAALADVLELAVSAAVASARSGTDGPFAPARQLLAASHQAVVEAEHCGDEAAPWPLGGWSRAALARLARLRAQGALARLAGAMGGAPPSWLRPLHHDAAKVVERISPKLPLPSETEALQICSERDPLAALLVDA
ncbi:unnamed protein product, partial [Effrenium voratum]